MAICPSIANFWNTSYLFPPSIFYNTLNMFADGLRRNVFLEKEPNEEFSILMMDMLGNYSTNYS